MLGTGVIWIAFGIEFSDFLTVRQLAKSEFIRAEHWQEWPRREKELWESWFCTHDHNLQQGLVSPSSFFILLGKGFPFCSQCWFWLSPCPHFTISLRLLHVQIYSYHHWPSDWHWQTLPCDLISNKSLITEEAAINLVQITFPDQIPVWCVKILEIQVPPIHIHISIIPKWDLVALLCDMRQDSRFALMSVISSLFSSSTSQNDDFGHYFTFFF